MRPASRTHRTWACPNLPGRADPPPRNGPPPAEPAWTCHGPPPDPGRHRQRRNAPPPHPGRLPEGGMPPRSRLSGLRARADPAPPSCRLPPRPPPCPLLRPTHRRPSRSQPSERKDTPGTEANPVMPTTSGPRRDRLRHLACGLIPRDRPPLPFGETAPASLGNRTTLGPPAAAAPVSSPIPPSSSRPQSLVLVMAARDGPACPAGRFPWAANWDLGDGKEDAGKSIGGLPGSPLGRIREAVASGRVEPGRPSTPPG